MAAMAMDWFQRSITGSGCRGEAREESSLFAQDMHKVPGIGGCIPLTEHHSQQLLPEEVVLFEPSQQEIWADSEKESPSTRLIFLNTPLTEAEVKALAAFRREWIRRNKGCTELPEAVRLSALRILQHKKFDVSKAVDLVSICLEERVKRLPLSEADLMPDLSSGALYWHGRDRMCRPCLVVRIGRMSELIKEPERCVKLVIYVLEYGIRHAMVPGRVENWVVVVDFQNAADIVSFVQLPYMCLVAKSIAMTLEYVYCGRMVWVKLLNLPSILSKFVQSVIPSEKKKKVNVVEDPKRGLLQFFEANQLEARYGGIQPDCAPTETYPFRFFAGCRGWVALNPDGSKSSKSAGSESTASTSSLFEDEVSQCCSDSWEGMSLHQHTCLAFHEGQLWDTNVMETWLHQARNSSLTPQSAKALTMLSSGVSVQPCQTIERWMELLENRSMPVLLSSQRRRDIKAKLQEQTLDSENAKLQEVTFPTERIRHEQRTTLISL